MVRRIPPPSPRLLALPARCSLGSIRVPAALLARITTGGGVHCAPAHPAHPLPPQFSLTSQFPGSLICPAGAAPSDVASLACMHSVPCRLKSHGLQVLVERPVAQAEFPEFDTYHQHPLHPHTATTSSSSGSSSGGGGGSSGGSSSSSSSSSSSKIDLCITLGGEWLAALVR